MDKLIAHCIEDMKSVTRTSKLTLDVQVRAYDLLQTLGEAADRGVLPSESASKEFCAVYNASESLLGAAYDETELRAEYESMLKPFQDAVTEARFEAASAAALHEFAKEVFEIWQNSGIFARRRALNELRERAGFRLESHRIGNYVAKTFDLAAEAQARFARAQQQLFKADVSYKLRPGVYGEIYNLLSAILFQSLI